MFGKDKTQKTQNDQFVMAMGRKVGNLKSPRKAVPVVNKAGVKGRVRMGALGNAKRTLK